MKEFMKIGILFMLIVLGLGSFSLRKERNFVPPGTVEINDTFFVDETEVSNFSWKEYVYWTAKKYGKDSHEYNSTLPDTLVWLDSLIIGGLNSEYYYVHPAYRDYPVVGITYEQALNFCKWKTEVVHIWQEIKSGKRKNEDRYKSYIGKLMFEYRLPTKKEWESFAMIGSEQKVKEKYFRNCKCTNVKGEKIHCSDTLLLANLSKDKKGDWIQTDMVYSYIPNKLGLYNIIGNVSEMVLEVGISKGGSWKSTQHYNDILRSEYYTEPNPSTGFRCVCVIKK